MVLHSVFAWVTGINWFWIYLGVYFINPNKSPLSIYILIQTCKSAYAVRYDVAICIKSKSVWNHELNFLNYKQFRSATIHRWQTSHCLKLCCLSLFLPHRTKAHTEGKQYQIILTFSYASLPRRLLTTSVSFLKVISSYENWNTAAHNTDTCVSNNLRQSPHF